MSKDIAKEEKKCKSKREGIETDVAALEQVLNNVATTDLENFDLNNVFSNDEEDVYEKFFEGAPELEEEDYEMQEEMLQRNEFLTGRYPHELNDKNGCSSLRKLAVTLNLAVSRSTSRRISFYVRGTKKIGNTFVHFSRTKKDSQVWTITGDVKSVLAKWEEIDPVQKPSSRPVRIRAQKTIWNSKSLVFLRKVLTTTSLTHRQIADMLNLTANGYRAPNSRPFTAKDVGNKVRNIFPRELDVHHLMWTLQSLVQQKGWETLEYHPEYCPTTNGLTLKCLVVTMPHAERLVELFGHVIHTDCTFGVLIYSQQVRNS